MPFNWTDTAEKQLLMRILQLTSPKLPDFNDVVAGMPEGVTAEACKHRMRKIKKEIETMGASSNASSGDEVRTKTPKAKKGGVRSKKTNGAPAKNKRKATESPSAEMGVEAEEDDEESPSKKVKTQAIKQEKLGEDDEDREGDDWFL